MYCINAEARQIYTHHDSCWPDLRVLCADPVSVEPGFVLLEMSGPAAKKGKRKAAETSEEERAAAKRLVSYGALLLLDAAATALGCPIRPATQHFPGG